MNSEKVMKPLPDTFILEKSSSTEHCDELVGRKSDELERLRSDNEVV